MAKMPKRWVSLHELFHEESEREAQLPPSSALDGYVSSLAAAGGWKDGVVLPSSLGRAQDAWAVNHPRATGSNATGMARVLHLRLVDKGETEIPKGEGTITLADFRKSSEENA